MEPDNQLFGMLMKAAGAAGDLDLVRGLRDEMQREGLTPCTVRRWSCRSEWCTAVGSRTAAMGWLVCVRLTASHSGKCCVLLLVQELSPSQQIAAKQMVVLACCLLFLTSLLSLLPVFPLVQGTESALMAVHIKLGQLPEAHLVYRSLRASGQWPHPYAMNALLNAYANSFRCVVGGQVQSRGNCSKPTQFTRVVVVAGEEVKQCLAWTRGEEQRQGRAWLTLLARPQRDSSCIAARACKCCKTPLQRGCVLAGLSTHSSSNRSVFVQAG